MDAFETRVARHAALGDPVRLAIVDELSLSDRSPVELRRRVRVESNLLAHHLGVLEQVGLIERHHSSGDGRRRYVRLRRDVYAAVGSTSHLARRPALFVCTRNAARSRLAAAVWNSLTGMPGESAGTHPAAQVHPGAIAAARRAGLAIDQSAPRALEAGMLDERLVVTVCDQAHEELEPADEWLHWSLPDPVRRRTAAAFDASVRDLRDRIGALVEPDEPVEPAGRP